MKKKNAAFKQPKCLGMKSPSFKPSHVQRRDFEDQCSEAKKSKNTPGQMLTAKAQKASCMLWGALFRFSGAKLPCNCTKLPLFETATAAEIKALRIELESVQDALDQFEPYLKAGKKEEA